MRSFSLRLLAAGALVVSAWVHIDLASVYDAVGGTVTQGALFRAQGIVAALVAAVLLVTGHRLAWLAGLAVAAGSLALVLLYRYVDVPALGPIPSMYEPAWYFRKTLSAIAEAGFLAVWLTHLALVRSEGPERRRRGMRQRPGLARR
jgi:hypothetical protein